MNSSTVRHNPCKEQLDSVKPENSTSVDTLEIEKLEVLVHPRAVMNQEAVKEYQEHIRHLPPIVVGKIKNKYFIIDGQHRLAAFKRAKHKSIPAIISDAKNKEDLIRRALKANHTHGLRRTNKDKRKAVEIALEHLSKKSDRFISIICGVSPQTVTTNRNQLSKLDSSTREGKDGKVRRIPEKKSKSKPPSPNSHPESASDKSGKKNSNPNNKSSFTYTAPEVTESDTTEQGNGGENKSEDMPLPSDRLDNLRVSWGRASDADKIKFLQWARKKDSGLFRQVFKNQMPGNP